MLTTILFATSATPACANAAQAAFGLAQASKAALTLLYVLPITNIGDSTQVRHYDGVSKVDGNEAYKAEVMAHLKRLYAELLAKVPGCRIELAVGKPSREILRQAREQNPDLIVMGATGVEDEPVCTPGLTCGGLRQVAKHAPCPVLSVGTKATVSGKIATVLLASDYSKAAASALEFAQGAAQGATLHILHVGPGDLEANRSKLASHYAHAPKAVFATRHGVAEEAILAYAKEIKADLIVMPPHAGDGLDEEFGTTLEQVIAGAPCPVASVAR